MPSVIRVHSKSICRPLCNIGIYIAHDNIMHVILNIINGVVDIIEGACVIICKE